MYTFHIIIVTSPVKVSSEILSQWEVDTNEKLRRGRTKTWWKCQERSGGRLHLARRWNWRWRNVLRQKLAIKWLGLHFTPTYQSHIYPPFTHFCPFCLVHFYPLPACLVQFWFPTKLLLHPALPVQQWALANFCTQASFGRFQVRWSMSNPEDATKNGSNYNLLQNEFYVLICSCERFEIMIQLAWKKTWHFTIWGIFLFVTMAHWGLLRIY